MLQADRLEVVRHEREKSLAHTELNHTRGALSSLWLFGCLKVRQIQDQFTTVGNDDMTHDLTILVCHLGAKEDGFFDVYLHLRNDSASRRTSSMVSLPLSVDTLLTEMGLSS